VVPPLRDGVAGEQRRFGLSTIFFYPIVAKPRKRLGSLDSLLSKSASFIFLGKTRLLFFSRCVE